MALADSAKDLEEKAPRRRTSDTFWLRWKALPPRHLNPREVATLAGGLTVYRLDDQASVAVWKNLDLYRGLWRHVSYFLVISLTCGEQNLGKAFEAILS